MGNMDRMVLEPKRPKALELKQNLYTSISTSGWSSGFWKRVYLPAYLPAYLPTYRPTDRPTFLPPTTYLPRIQLYTYTQHSYRHTFIPPCPPTYLHTSMHACTYTGKTRMSRAFPLSEAIVGEALDFPPQW